MLKAVNYGARHITRPGRLGRIRSIHFARWVFIAGRERMIFCSNYDGSDESYMDDFINKTGFGLNASFSNGIGYPRTNWLVRDGCIDERKYQGIPPTSYVPKPGLVQGLSQDLPRSIWRETLGFVRDWRCRRSLTSKPANGSHCYEAKSITPTCKVWCALDTVT